MEYGEHATPRKRSLLRSLLSLLLTIAFIFGLSWALRTFVFQPYEIPSGSMEQTIMTGDMVFSEKLTYYFNDPKPGDIVTFLDPEIPSRVLIKRCVAVGGQVVDLVDGRVVVDGVLLSEPYTRGLPSEPLKTALGVEVAYPYKVPAGHLWVMGDNRTNSNDSRYFGAIDQSTLTGRAMFTYWPLGSFGPLN